jgi:hypothetical protein
LDTGDDRCIALDIRGLVGGSEEAVVVVVCGRRTGICRIGDDALIISSSGFVVIVVVTGIVRLKRRETDGKCSTLEFMDGSSVELLKRY